MPKVIYKYPLSIGGTVIIRSPSFKPLSVQLQSGQATLWAEVEPDGFGTDWPVTLVGTGWQVPQRSEYIGTVQMFDGTVWHAYLLK